MTTGAPRGMSDNGPPTDIADPLLAGIEEALGELGIDEQEARRSLLDGVREALTGLAEASASGVGVRVIRGGRADNAPRSAEAPPLRLADERDTPEPPPRVRVVRVGAPVEPEAPSLGQGGVVRLSPDTGAKMQTIYRGESRRVYRLVCDTGSFEVSVDGVHVERLVAGQSLDIEGRLLRVHTTAEGEGRYVPI